ncbi:MAG: cytochrome c3 family protein [Thermodesulfovibrionales bacterium]
MMRKNSLKVIVTVLVAASITLLLSVSYAGIIGSQHDMSIGGTSNFSGSFTGDNDEPCVYCHTPHSAAAGIQPLWNRNLNTANGFSVYTSPTMDSSPLATPSQTSLLCLSCHDGISAINAIINTPGPGSIPLVVGGATRIGDLGSSAKFVNIGDEDPLAPGAVNLTNDHPVSIDWASRGAGFLANPTAPARLVNGMVECTSCHDVHNGTPFELGGLQFMLMSNAGSALCVSCHTK